jgi:hypothetical protein
MKVVEAICVARPRDGLLRKQVARDGGNIFEVMMDVVPHCSVRQVTPASLEMGEKFRRDL